MNQKWPVVVVNLVTVIGGVLGLVSMFVPWVVKTELNHYTLIDVLIGPTDIGLSLDFVLQLAAVIYLMGVASVFLSPYGAAAQLGGCAIAFFSVGIAEIGNSGVQSVSFGPGPSIGFVSSVIVFLSVIFPFGIGYGHWKPLGNRGRNYTISFYRNLYDSDGMPYWWWAEGPGWFWYWWFEMRMGWAYRDAWEQHQKLRAARSGNESVGTGSSERKA